ncbi:Rpn family recombination-promoting nuclease/putative transposase [Nocardia sp. NPDC004722]
MSTRKRLRGNLDRVGCPNMADTPSNPHDAYFRQVMGRAADAAGVLRANLPATFAARTRWDELVLQPGSFVSPQLRSRFSDLLFATRLDGHPAFVYMLIEHQSRPDPLMAFRMLEYMVAIWTRYLRDHPKATTLPVVIPLVIHASPKGERWNKPTELGNLLDIDPTTRTELGDHLPRLRFLLDDLTAIDVAELCARDLTPSARVMLVLQKIAPRSRHLDTDLLPLLGDLTAMFFSPAGKAELTGVLTYILKVADINEADLGAALEQLGPEAKEVIMTTADRLRAEGEVQGEARGRAKSLIELLSLKFGELPQKATTAIDSADPKLLQLWTARVLTADTLDEVFQP